MLVLNILLLSTEFKTALGTVEKQPIKAVKSDEPKSHHEYCTCCICDSDRELSRKKHPKICTCCICRYRCRYDVRSRKKQQMNKSRKNVKEMDVTKKSRLGKEGIKLQGSKKFPKNDKLYKSASQISSLVQNVRKVSGYLIGFASNIEKIFRELYVKPCYCGLSICKHETRKLQELRQRNFKFNAPPECVCGSKVCKVKHTKETPYYKARAKRKKMKAKEKKKWNKQLRQETNARIKRYSKEDALIRKRVMCQDKKAMKMLEKYEDSVRLGVAGLC